MATDLQAKPARLARRVGSNLAGASDQRCASAIAATAKDNDRLSREQIVALSRKMHAAKRSTIDHLWISPRTIEALCRWKDALKSGVLTIRDLSHMIGEGNDEGDENTTEQDDTQRPLVTKFLSILTDINFEYSKLQQSDAAQDSVKGRLYTLVDSLFLKSLAMDVLIEPFIKARKELVALDGPLLRAAQACGIGREDFLNQYASFEQDDGWMARVQASSSVWERFAVRHQPDVNQAHHRMSEIAKEVGVPLSVLRSTVCGVVNAQSEERRSAEAIIEANLRLVLEVVSHKKEFLFDKDDLIQEGRIGLMRAVEKFDPDLDFEFSTYAVRWIRQSIGYARARKEAPIPIPVNTMRLRQEYIAANSVLSRDMGIAPTDAELAAHLRWPEPTVKRVREAVLHIVPNTHLSEDNSATILDMVADHNPKPDDIAFQNCDRSIIDHLFDAARLSDRERFILTAHFSDQEVTLDDIGEKLGGITRERVRQIKKKALGKLKAKALHDDGTGIYGWRVPRSNADASTPNDPPDTAENQQPEKIAESPTAIVPVISVETPLNQDAPIASGGDDLDIHTPAIDRQIAFFEALAGRAALETAAEQAAAEAVTPKFQEEKSLASTFTILGHDNTSQISDVLAQALRAAQTSRSGQSFVQMPAGNLTIIVDSDMVRALNRNRARTYEDWRRGKPQRCIASENTAERMYMAFYIASHGNNVLVRHSGQSVAFIGNPKAVKACLGKKTLQLS